jgi:peptidoglycan hydrolase CwlO-like protein
MNTEKRIVYYNRLLERVEKEIQNSGTDYDYLEIMFEAKKHIVSRLDKLKIITD